MGQARNTDPLPHPKATGLTLAICGFATLALAAVLGFSLAGNAPGEGEPIRIVAQPPAAEVIADAGPFGTAGCTTLVTARR
ncbi:hypothetical protein [Inquilinus limosus]|uniref:Uncharacterized protein n=1 Tax=Inquilinus limosus MP06 TaxID=1398085 RepID=A0A0A0DBU2_9PROT|nr:hypothetical protein [Inquilinus limosus]KGM35495.1 hypothetical protein P409_04150 [Inquilinus limosus MP06]